MTMIIIEGIIIELIRKNCSNEKKFGLILSFTVIFEVVVFGKA